MKNSTKNLISLITAKSSIALISGIAIATMTGCATTSNISPQYVSPNTYSNYNCQQLSQEFNRINGYVKQAEKRSFSLASTGINLGLAGNKNGIYPTISLGTNVGGTNQAKKAKLGKLYGERDAVIQSTRIKNCSFSNGLKIHGE